MVEKKDIEHLAELARITLDPDEITSLQTEIESILGYVGEVKHLTTDSVDTKVVGPRHNVFREDEVTNQPESYTKVLLDEAPETKDGYVVVKKILNN